MGRRVQENELAVLIIVIADSAGAPVNPAGTLTAVLSKDGGTFATATNSVATVDAARGIYSLTTTATESNTTGDITLIVTSSDGTVVIFRDTFEVYDPVTLAEINTEVDTAISDAGLTDLSNLEDKSVLITTTIDVVTSQTVFTLADGSTDDDAYNDALMVIVDVAASNQKSFVMIDDYVGSTKTITLKNAPAFTVVSTDKIRILAVADIPTAVEIRQEVDSSSTQLAAIVADTAAILIDSNELQTDWANGGRLDLLIDAILEDTGTTLPATLGVIDGIVDAILVDTGTTLPATLGVIDGIVDAILVDTGTTIPGQISGLNNLASADVLTQVNAALDAAIPELSVALPSATPSIRAALMLLYMARRNNGTGTATLRTIANDAGTTVAQQTISDDGATFTQSKMVSG